jgi:hypothetical protein
MRAIPTGVTIIPENCFYQCPNISIYKFGDDGTKDY